MSIVFILRSRNTFTFQRFNKKRFNIIIFSKYNMPKPKPTIKFDLCRPVTCSPEDGVCVSTLVCRKKVLIQEDTFDSPLLFSCSICTGCGDCANKCPLGAIVMG